QAGVGVHIPFGGRGFHATLALKYVHVSNAGLSEPNPGLNSVQVRLGFGMFKK
ncbi:MAG: acyloxyacyl hydrolase, partial [Acidobacteria bacterium]|nr:acyloxyacyl hydrolase [Acidobacteriota bacterium]